MVNFIQHDGSLKSGRMEDICLCSSHRSPQNECKMESTAYTSPSFYLPTPLNLRRLQSSSKSFSSASLRSNTNIWNPVYLFNLLLLLLVCFSHDTVAADLQFRSNDVSVSRIREQRSAFVDSRIKLQNVKKVRRQQDDDGDDDDDTPSTATRAGSVGTQRPTSSTNRPSTQEPDLVIPLPTGLPKPFDSSIGTNFSNTGCQTFLDDMLNAPEFAACEPLSFLLETSRGFFEAAKSFVRITQVLDATCNVDFDNCRAVMDQFAEELDTEETCAQDLEKRQPNVFQAYHALLAYAPLYRAGCSKDEDSDYCFASPTLDSDQQANNYVFYLPLGSGIPGGDRPDCNSCTKDIMDIYADVASNGTLLISETYPQAAQQINLGCGPEFAETNIEVEGSATGFMRRVSWESDLLAFLLATATAYSFLP